MSIVEVTARIEQIQNRFAPPSANQITAAQFAAQLQASARSASPAGATATVPRTAAASAPGVSGLPDVTTGREIVADAKRYLGVPYVWGGTDPSKGLDCSGLVQRVYRDLGYDLPRVSYEQAKAGRAVRGLENARPGDILAFNSPVSHVAIYAGGGRMIEAPRPGLSVRVVDVYQTPTAIRRILPDEARVAVPSGGQALQASLDRQRIGLGAYLQAAQVAGGPADGGLR